MDGTSRFGRAEPYRPHDELDLLAQYLAQISATPLLTAEQEIEMAKRIEAGVYARHLLDTSGRDLPAQRRAELGGAAADGTLAKDHMIRANLRLVVSAAKKYAGRGVPLLDIIQDGNLGLIRAVEKFDYARGYKFSTYAMWWIRQAIQRGIAEKRHGIRLPLDVVEDISRYARIERRLLLDLGRDPTNEEIAEAAGDPTDKVETLRRLARGTVSLDKPINEAGQVRIGDLIADTDTIPQSEVVEHRELAAQLRSLVDTLPCRQALILTLRFGLSDGRPRSLQEIGERIGLTRERVRQLEKEALAQLRDPERGQSLLAWAG